MSCRRKSSSPDGPLKKQNQRPRQKILFFFSFLSFFLFIYFLPVVGFKGDNKVDQINGLVQIGMAAPKMPATTNNKAFLFLSFSLFFFFSGRLATSRVHMVFSLQYHSIGF